MFAFELNILHGNKDLLTGFSDLLTQPLMLGFELTGVHSKQLAQK